ncbi:MAG: D-aminoacyl-tRNA deacylase [Firmicutes bacterium]|nr:D-aminoacyl-tRNA deacylase [Bacillota bacterium]
MIAVIQRVKNASVSVDGEVKGRCGAGLMILLGAKRGDMNEDAVLLAEKISKLRIFSDEAGKMNLSINDIHGEALVVSQFTLLANYRHGNRPDFFDAAAPEEANELYELFVSELKSRLDSEAVETGVFGADMLVNIENDGPVTIVMESEKLKKQ